MTKVHPTAGRYLQAPRWLCVSDPPPPPPPAPLPCCAPCSLCHTADHLFLVLICVAHESGRSATPAISDDPLFLHVFNVPTFMRKCCNICKFSSTQGKTCHFADDARGPVITCHQNLENETLASSLQV